MTPHTSGAAADNAGYSGAAARRPLIDMRTTALAALILLLLAACASGADSRKQEEALYVYASAIRWGHIDEALGFVDPEVLASKPLTAVERARFEQVQVAGYQVKSSAAAGKDELEQLVEIRLVNRHTQVERVIHDRQRWRWDGTAKRWWLVSGLPDISQR